MNTKGFSEQVRGILKLLKDNRWHTGDEIQDAASYHIGQIRYWPTEHLRRLRHLRTKGYNIECKNFGGRDFRYRLVGKK